MKEDPKSVPGLLSFNFMTEIGYLSNSTFDPIELIDIERISNLSRYRLTKMEVDRRTRTRTRKGTEENK